MINIREFKGVSYNPDKIADLSQVVCPPYDVINREEQDFYYRRSPYNFIRLILNRDEQGDDSTNNRYIRSTMFFNEWLKEGILKQDSQKAVYFYKQDYFSEDKELSRLGFIALLEISDTGIIFPHENTHAAPKTDRLELIKNIKANLSPIFTIFSDKGRIVENIFKNDLSKRQPDLLLKDAQGIRNSLWRLTHEKKIQEIGKKMKEKQIFIADGHHRFEVATMYSKLMQQQDSDYSPDKSYNYIMTYFTPLESESLHIMPVHRVIKPEIDIGCLKNIFKISSLNYLADLEVRLKKFSKKQSVFGLYYKNDILLLELKDKKQAQNYFEKRKCFSDLDVAILDFYILSELLKVKKDAIIYTKEAAEAKELVDNKEGTAAFILRPTSVDQIRDVALCGEKMPSKSTYFYPKLLSGLVVHKFSENITYRSDSGHKL